MNENPPETSLPDGYDATIFLQKANVMALLTLPAVWLWFFVPYRCLWDES
jgi:hypothetical protein